MGKVKRKYFFRKKQSIEKFKQEIYKNITGSRKVEMAWEMVVEAMTLKGMKHRLKFDKKAIKYKPQLEKH